MYAACCYYICRTGCQHQSREYCHSEFDYKLTRSLTVNQQEISLSKQTISSSQISIINTHVDFKKKIKDVLMTDFLKLTEKKV